MPVEVALNTPLAEALSAAIQPKLLEVGWGTGGSDDSALAEYVILMLANGNSQEQIAAELSGDLLNLSPDDPGVREFSSWLFQQVDTLNAQLNGGQPAAGGNDEGAGISLTDGISGDMDTDMAANDVSELNA